MRILSINIPNEGLDYFPMHLEVLEVPQALLESTGHSAIGFDPVWAIHMLTEPAWDVMRQLPEDHKPIAVIKIDHYTPEMVDKGRAMVLASASTIDESLDDVCLAATYIHRMVCDMYCCACIFSWQW